MKLTDYINGVQHIGIPTNCFNDTMKFYTDLGFEVENLTKVEAKNQRVVFLRSGNLQLEVYEENPIAGKAGAINHIALDCHNVKDAYEAAKNAGYKIVSEEIESLPFWENGISFFIIEGLNAERIEFCQRF